MTNEPCIPAQYTSIQRAGRVGQVVASPLDGNESDQARHGGLPGWPFFPRRGDGESRAREPARPRPRHRTRRAFPRRCVGAPARAGDRRGLAARDRDAAGPMGDGGDPWTDRSWAESGRKRDAAQRVVAAALRARHHPGRPGRYRAMGWYPLWCHRVRQRAGDWEPRAHWTSRHRAPTWTAQGRRQRDPAQDSGVGGPGEVQGGGADHSRGRGSILGSAGARHLRRHLDRVLRRPVF